MAASITADTPRSLSARKLGGLEAEKQGKPTVRGLVRRNVADQLEQRVDPAKAYASLRDEGFLPLHLDEITTGKIFNTLAMQAFLDRFNLIFQGIAEPVDGEVSDKILKDIFAPFWKQYHDGILYLMNDGTEPPKA